MPASSDTSVARTASPRLTAQVEATTRNALPNMVHLSISTIPMNVTDLSVLFRDLSDMQRRGVLDVAEFTIAMYLVQSCMSGQLTTVPPSLPPLLYEQAGVALAPGLSAPIIGMRPSGSSVPRSSSHLGAGLVAPHSLPDAIGGADRAFDILDPQGTGRALGEVVAPFMLQLGMPVDVLTRIWCASLWEYVMRPFAYRSYTVLNPISQGSCGHGSEGLSDARGVCGGYESHRYEEHRERTASITTRISSSIYARAPN